MFRRMASASIGIAVMSLATVPVQAQYMMHLDPNLYMLMAMQMSGGVNTCITGMALSDKKVEEARQPTLDAMKGYFAAAQSGAPKSASFRVSKKAEWTFGTTVAPLAQIDAQSDPLAAAANRLDPDPLRFFRSGDGQTTQGQWLVNGADGSVAGLYDGVFKRERGIWKLERLTLYGAADKVAPAMQYCTTPGDVTAHRVKAATDQIANLEKEIAKSEAKLELAKAQVSRAEAALAAKPGDTTQREAARTAQQDVAAREKKLADLKKNLTDAQEYRDKSNRDKEEIAALTLPAAEAARFRGFETTTAKEDARKKAEDEAKRAEEKAKKKAAKES